jgi:hypothetical protein
MYMKQNAAKVAAKLRERFAWSKAEGDILFDTRFTGNTNGMILVRFVI